MNLYKHQQDLLDKNPKKILLAWETGTGKTVGAITLVDKNIDESEKCLVICPKSLKEKWQSDINKFSDIGHLYEVMTKEEFRSKWDSLEEYKFLVSDEAHYFSGFKSKMVKSFLNYINKHDPEYIYLLTATPYLSTPFNIWTLARILGYDWNWWKFKKYFFYDIKMGNRVIPKLKTEINGKSVKSIIAGLVNKIGETVKLQDCVDVPEQIFETEIFSLTFEQRKAIEDLEEPVHIVRWTKIHQIIGGTLKGDGYIKDQFYPSEKFNRLQELVNEHPKIIIVCRYNNEIKYLFENLKVDYPIYKITGETKDKHELLKIADREKNAVVLVNAACSEGWELPSFPIMVFYSYDFSLKNYIQMIGRIQRINAIKKNVYLSLVTKDKKYNIDWDVYQSILRKEDFQIEIYKK